MAEWDSGTKETVKKIPLLTTKAGPRDKDLWEKRLKEELQALIKYIQLNKASDSDWFTITSNKEGTAWSGKCWYIHNLQRFEFDFNFDIPATYPATAPEIRIPELEGKTAKMYRGGSICLTVHFKPLWAKNRGKAARFIDKLRITVQAGKGGNGCNSLWASRAKGKFKPPDGGSGGRGGDVIVRASIRTRSFAGLNHLHKAEAGGHGRDKRLIGCAGKPCFIEVPLGTVVYLPEDKEAEASIHEVPHWIRNPGQIWRGATDYDKEFGEEAAESLPAGVSSEAVQKRKLGTEIADLENAGDEIVLARGGAGGKGSAFLSTAVRKSKDLSSMRGGPGERLVAYLEMRTIADIGLVGAPNAGKSSLLKALSGADPKVASYPFTTLQPQLGAVHIDPFLSLTMADIPGLIEGAALNKGLGHAFLRHISRARALVYVLDSSSGMGCDSGPKPWDQLAALQAELSAYSRELVEKPAIVVANKVDKLGEKDNCIKILQQKTNLQVVPLTALPGRPGFSNAAITELKKHLSSIVPL